MPTDNADRITRYMQTASGGHRLSLTVRGIRVTVEPGDDAQQAAVEALAVAIAALGPADAAPSTALPPPVATDVIPAPAASKPFAVGERVFCRVSGVRAWCTVTEVGTGRNHGRIKITGERAWCPVGNFTRTPAP